MICYMCMILLLQLFTLFMHKLIICSTVFLEKAMMLSIEMDHDDFAASNGWLECWLKRYNVKLAVLCGESAEVPQDVVDDWGKRLPALTEGYDLADIYNADETGLYFRALPNRSMVIKGDPRKGIKTSKEWITVLLACSAASERQTPLVIGKAVNPMCFWGVDKALLPVTYRANRKARASFSQSGWSDSTQGWNHRNATFWCSSTTVAPTPSSSCPTSSSYSFRRIQRHVSSRAMLGSLRQWNSLQEALGPTRPGGDGHSEYCDGAQQESRHNGRHRLAVVGVV